jgi:hypothetical protein
MAPEISNDHRDRGEPSSSMPASPPNTNDPVIGASQPNKWPADVDENLAPRKTRGVYLDYRRLDNPFEDTDDEEDSMIAIQSMILDKNYNAAVCDGPTNLKEAKQSPDWLEWKNGIRAELEQL